MAEPKEIGTVWTLGCEVFIEDALTAEVQEIKVNDIVLSANIFTEGLSVEVGSDRVNAMDLDVRISMDGLKTYIIDSQIVPYEDVLKITDFSPEATNEKRYAASALSAKKIYGVLESGLSSLKKRVDEIELNGVGGSGDSVWKIDKQGNIWTDKRVIIKNNLIVEGDTSSGGEGEDTPSAGLDETRLQEYLDEHKYVTEYDIAGLIPSNIATVDYVNTKFNSIDLSPYATTTELKALANRFVPIETWMDNVGQHITYDAELDAIVINHNLIVTKDTSSGGEGEDTPASGIRGIYVNGTPYTDTDGDGFIDLGTISGGTADLSNYYTKAESDNRYLASSLLGSNTLIHTGNIGSYNAGSATKLQTARTIWGQSFDGTGNVSGMPRFSPNTYSSSITTSSSSIVLSSKAASMNGYNTGIALAAIGGYDSNYQNHIHAWIGLGARTSTSGAELYPLVFATNNSTTTNTAPTERMRIMPNGNVLIGTSTDSGFKLDVNGGVRMKGTNSAAMSAGAGSLVVMDNTGAMLMFDANDIQAKTAAGTVATKLYINDWGGDVIFCSAGIGYVGIGTESPSAKLHVDGQINLSAGTNNNYSFIRSENYSSNISLLRIGTCYGYGSEASAITAYNGCVGIGVDIPQYKLDVNGKFRASDNVIIGSSSYEEGRLRVVGKNGDTYVMSVCDYDGWTKFAVFNNGNTEVYGNLVVSGDTSSGSDIRFKDVIKNKTLKIEHIAKAPLFTFKWNDREDDSIHLGSSAQYWEKVCPWLVTGEDFKSLNYATLGVAMGISLAKKAVNHEARIKELEREIKRLKEEMRYGDR